MVTDKMRELDSTLNVYTAWLIFYLSFDFGAYYSI